MNKCFLFQIESTLVNMYSYLQKLAVGLEQVALDQIIFDGRYDEEFNLAEYRLKGVSYFHKSNNKGRNICNGNFKKHWI